MRNLPVGSYACLRTGQVLTMDLAHAYRGVPSPRTAQAIQQHNDRVANTGERSYPGAGQAVRRLVRLAATVALTSGLAACDAFTAPVTCRVTGADTSYVRNVAGTDSVRVIVTTEWCE